MCPVEERPSLHPPTLPHLITLPTPTHPLPPTPLAGYLPQRTPHLPWRPVHHLANPLKMAPALLPPYSLQRKRTSNPQAMHLQPTLQSPWSSLIERELHMPPQEGRTYRCRPPLEVREYPHSRAYRLSHPLRGRLPPIMVMRNG